jgi:hypothetical protein
MNVWIRWFILFFTSGDEGGGDIHKNKHYNLMKKVRNYSNLDNEELEFIKTLSKENLI